MHTLKAKVKVQEYFADDSQVVVGQIHAKDSSKALLKLQWDGPTKALRAIINADPVSGNPFNLTFDTVGTEAFNYVITLDGDTMSISINDGPAQSVTFGEGSMSSAWRDHVYYFKAGNYAQALVGSAGVFEVRMYELSVTHTP